MKINAPVFSFALLSTVVGCQNTDKGVADTGAVQDSAAPQDTDDTAVNTDDTGEDTDEDTDEDTAIVYFEPDWPEGTDPFADAVVSFEPGSGAGFGKKDYPEIVLGSPEGAGASAGSQHVLSLGEGGMIILEMTDLAVIDGDGPDLLVFENPFPGWLEIGVVAASEDGKKWFEWTCESDNADGGYPGCAGVNFVHATSELLVDPTDPEAAGGDAFDLADIGLSQARFIRIRDSGTNKGMYDGTSGGFDLDAISAANWAPIKE